MFGVDIEHCTALAAAFNEAGTEAQVVTSRTKKEERKDVLAQFQSGQLPVLVNCGIFTEGTDIPAIDCIIMARPTRSSVLFQQILGRGVPTFVLFVALLLSVG